MDIFLHDLILSWHSSVQRRFEINFGGDMDGDHASMLLVGLAAIARVQLTLTRGQAIYNFLSVEENVIFSSN